MDEPRRPLLVVRGWSEALDPRHSLLLRRLGDAGLEVLDLYLPPEDSPTFDHWAARYADAIESMVPDTDAPIDFLGYCVGGSLLGPISIMLAERGRRLAYIGLIDARLETTAQRLAHNMHHRAKVPRRIRLNLFFRSLGMPIPEPLTRILKAWAVARARTVASFFTRGPRFLRRRRDPVWHTLHVAYSATFTGHSTPVHRYVARQSIETYGDLSLNTGPLSSAGFALRVVGGDHFTCLTDPHLDSLVRAILDDLRDPVPLLLEVDRGQFRSSPRSDR